MFLCSRSRFHSFRHSSVLPVSVAAPPPQYSISFPLHLNVASLSLPFPSFITPMKQMQASALKIFQGGR